MTKEERHIAVLNRLLENMDVYDSIQPTTERKKAIKAAIQALSQEPCDDVVSRILARMWNCRGKHTTSIDKVKMEQIIRDELPSVTRQAGEWIVYNYPAHECVYCSKCKTEYYECDLYLGGSEFPNFCPNCGAKMQESE